MVRFSDAAERAKLDGVGGRQRVHLSEMVLRRTPFATQLPSPRPSQHPTQPFAYMLQPALKTRGCAPPGAGESESRLPPQSPPAAYRKSSETFPVCCSLEVKTRSPPRARPDERKQNVNRSYTS